MLSRIGSAARRMMGWSGGGLDSAQSERRLKGFVAARQHVNTLVQSSGNTVLARARYLSRNNGYAANATDCFASAVIGYGIKPSWKLDDKVRRKSLQQQFGAWTDSADHEGVTDFYGLQSRVARELFVAGECFVRRMVGADEAGVPQLRLQVLPAEMLDPAHTVDLGGDHTIRQGIEFNRQGQRIAYHFWRENPGDMTQSLTGERVRIPASEILHVFDPIEAGQIRGLPRLTPAIVKLWLLDVYDDAELDRKKTAALFAGFVRRPASDDGSPLVASPSHADPSIAVAALEPGTLQFLEEGEEVTFSSPADVGGSYEAFQYRTLVQVAAAVGLPYAGVTGEVLRANYSNMRAALIEIRRRIERLQHGVVIFQLCRPVARWWIEIEQLAGRIDLPGYAEDPAPYLAVTWIPPRWEWVDPLKDRNAELLAVRAGFTTLSSVIEGEGYDAEEVLEEAARMNRVIDDLGLVLDSDPRKVSRAGLTQARPEGTALPDTAVPVAGDSDRPGTDDGGDAAVGRDPEGSA